MAKDSEKVYMPSGMGGLIRYSEEEEQLIKMTPKHVVGIVVGVVVFELIVKFLFV